MTKHQSLIVTDIIKNLINENDTNAVSYIIQMFALIDDENDESMTQHTFILLLTHIYNYYQ
jgi:hypothetical protein